MELDKSNHWEKWRRPISGKQWTIWLVAGAVTMMIGIAVINFIVDPYGYFHSAASEGSISYLPDTTYNIRLYNYKYFQLNHEKYKGVILGGSKGMNISAGHLSELRGIPYFKLSAEHGNFRDYLIWVRWLAENTQIQEIFLNLSTLEVDFYTEEQRNASVSGYYTPASLDYEKNKVTEFMQYLYKGGIKTSMEFLWRSMNGTLPVFVVNNRDEAVLYSMKQERKQDTQNRIDLVNKNLEERLYRASEGIHNEMPAMECNLEAVKEIKEICDQAGIRLEIAIANTYISQYLIYESQEYWEYLKDLADIAGYWDFSFSNVYNRNPYNFLDGEHAHADTLNCMLDQIYGEREWEEFGIFVTAENVDAHIKRRQRDYNSLISEYETCGNIRLGTAFDSSYLMDDLIYPAVSNTHSEQAPGMSVNEYLTAEQHFYAGFDYLQAVGIYALGLLEETKDRGILCMRIYDDTEKKYIYSQEIDTADLVNGYENILDLGKLELTEGHWYSFLFSYEPKIQDDSFSFIFVDGAVTDGIYLDIDGVTMEKEIKMNLYRPQTLGNYLSWQAGLKTDQMRGEGEGTTRCISDEECYVQTFQAECRMLSSIQIQASEQEGLPTAEDDYTVIFELQDSAGNLIGRKKVVGALLQNAGTYRIVMDGDIYLDEGKTYRLFIFADRASENGLKLMTHGADEAHDSILYVNGRKTDDSLCYRIYGLDEEQIGQVGLWECTQEEHISGLQK